MGGESYAAATLCGWRELDGLTEGRLGPTSPGPGRALQGTALVLELDVGIVEVSLSADGTVRIRTAASAVLPLPPEHAVERAPWQPIAAKAREEAFGGIALIGSRASLHVEVEPDPLTIRLVDRAGVSVVALCELAFDPNGKSRIALSAAPEDRFFGVGAAHGALNRRGQRLSLRNSEPRIEPRGDSIGVSLPFFLAQRAADRGFSGVLLDTFSTSHFDFASTRSDRVNLETESGGIDLMLFPGPDPREVIARYTQRVGRSPLPPLWALGHHRARRTPRSERAVRTWARELRRHGVPIDAIHLDLEEGAPRKRSRARILHSARLIDDLGRQGLHVVTSVGPEVAIDPDCEIYRSGCARDVFCKREDGSTFSAFATTLPDFGRVDVRAWSTDQVRALVELGIAGLACRGTERSEGLARLGARLRAIGSGPRVRSGLLEADPTEPKASVPHEQVHNLYTLQHCRAIRDALEAVGKERRPFLLTRSGTTGIQRYAGVSIGDGAGNWSKLRQSIPRLLNLSLSGVPLCGFDIGAGSLTSSQELFVRWMQIGALFPFVRTLETKHRGRRVQRIAHEAIALRMRLLPYLYSLFGESEERGEPVWRPLFYEFPDDPDAAACSDQLLIGPSLLVAPIVDRGARKRDVYLPAGTWTSWATGACYTGPRHLEVRAPIERIPMFVRGGSVIPLQSAVQHTGERPAEPCILAVYPGADASTTLLEDDGKTTAYRGGVTARTSLRLWSRAGGRLRLEVGRREGPFPIDERSLRVEIHGCPPPDAVYLDGARLSERAEAPGWVAYDGKLDVRLLDRGAGASIEIDPAP